MTWTALDAPQLDRLMSRIATPHRPEGFRAFVKDPGWYRQGALLELQTARAKATYIAAGAGDLADRAFFLLDGQGRQLHLGNNAAGIRIRDPAMAAAYLRFFCAFLDTDSGLTFNIVDGLAAGWCLENGQRPEVHPPLIAATAVHGRFEGPAFVEYGGMLFKASFLIRHDGMVEMMDDNPIGRLVRCQSGGRGVIEGPDTFQTGSLKWLN